MIVASTSGHLWLMLETIIFSNLTDDSLYADDVSVTRGLLKDTGKSYEKIYTAISVLTFG